MKLFPERYKPSVVIPFLVLWSLHAITSFAGDVDTFIDEIQLASRDVTAFSSDFIQEKHLTIFAEPVLFKGRLYVAKPNRLRWEFTAPMMSVLILDGEVGMRCAAKSEPTEFDLRNDPIMRGVAEQLWLWLGGDYKKLKSRYNVEKSGDHTLVVSPQKGSVSDFINSVTITFDGQSKEPQVVEISEPGGDLTRIKFTSYQRNPTLGDSLFRKCNIDD